MCVCVCVCRSSLSVTFSVASLGWMERTAASALFGTPPSSTYEEALDFFTKAEKVTHPHTHTLTHTHPH